MKRIGCMLVVLMLATPSWAAKKVTVQQLRDMLSSLQQAKKSDENVAGELKQVELSEELTGPNMNSLGAYGPGQLTLEQIYVLQAKSAILPPPAADLPATPAPDAATQKAILDKAMDYATKTFAQLPRLTATKTALRFQDNVETVAASSGMNSAASDSIVGGGQVAADKFVHYYNSTEIPVEMQNGAEKLSTVKDKTLWGANKQIALQGQIPVLNTVLAEAQATGSIAWVRWETVYGRTAAVYTFSVDKKKSHYAVNYCCFPNVDQTGTARFSGQMGTGMPGGSAGAGGGAKGNLQTNTDWSSHFKSTVPYHGEIFINPESGIVVRLITIAEFKNSDMVHQEDQRIDYGPLTIEGKDIVVPVETFINTEVVPNGDSGAKGYSTRRTLFTAKYKDYAVAK